MATMMQNMAGMGAMTDQVIATDLLMSAKSGIKNIAIAITESSTPEVRAALQQQFSDAVRLHEQVSNYMISNGYYHPQDVQEQLRVDLTASQTALDLTNQQQ